MQNLRFEVCKRNRCDRSPRQVDASSDALRRAVIGARRASQSDALGTTTDGKPLVIAHPRLLAQDGRRAVRSPQPAQARRFDSRRRRLAIERLELLEAGLDVELQQCVGLDGSRLVGMVTLDDLVADGAVDSATLAAIVRAQLAEPARLKHAGERRLGAAVHEADTFRGRRDELRREQRRAVPRRDFASVPQPDAAGPHESVSRPQGATIVSGR